MPVLLRVCRASKDLALLVAKQHASKLGAGKGGAVQFLVDQVQSLGGGPEGIGVPMPPPLPASIADGTAESGSRKANK